MLCGSIRFVFLEEKMAQLIFNRLKVRGVFKRHEQVFDPYNLMEPTNIKAPLDVQNINWKFLHFQTPENKQIWKSILIRASLT
jgi:hypothetical protein